MEVAGRAFLYSVREKEVRSWGPHHNTAAVLTAMADPGPGSAMRCLRAFGEPFTPQAVREAIAEALSRGWRPEARGPAFVMDQTPEEWGLEA